jgi:hypothetical protein
MPPDLRFRRAAVRMERPIWQSHGVVGTCTGQILGCVSFSATESGATQCANILCFNSELVVNGLARVVLRVAHLIRLKAFQ